MMIRGVACCAHCGKEVPWFYQVPNRLSDGRIDIEVFPQDRVGLRSKPYLLHDNVYEMEFWCPHCDYLSSFEYQSEIALR